MGTRASTFSQESGPDIIAYGFPEAFFQAGVNFLKFFLGPGVNVEPVAADFTALPLADENMGAEDQFHNFSVPIVNQHLKLSFPFLPWRRHSPLRKGKLLFSCHFFGFSVFSREGL